MLIAELRAELSRRGLSTTGKKTELEQRLSEDDSSNKRRASPSDESARKRQRGDEVPEAQAMAVQLGLLGNGSSSMALKERAASHVLSAMSPTAPALLSIMAGLGNNPVQGFRT